MLVYLHFWRQGRAPLLRPGPRCSVAAHPKVGVTHDSAFPCPILVLPPIASLSPSCSCSDEPLTLASFSRDPLADVCWAILELDVAGFAALKKTDSVLIH